MQAYAVVLEKQEIAPSPFELAEEQFGAIKVTLSSPAVRQMTHSEVEKLLEVDGGSCGLAPLFQEPPYTYRGELVHRPGSPTMARDWNRGVYTCQSNRPPCANLGER